MLIEGTFRRRTGVDLYTCRWETTAPKANVVIIHGYGEHCRRYEHVANAFNQAGINVHTYDQEGFGRSPGTRGRIYRFEALLEEIDDFLNAQKNQLDGKPLFLMGQSMGGLLLARYAETRTFSAQGLIFASPFLAFADDVPKFLLALAPVLGKWLPWLPVRFVDYHGLSRDPVIAEIAATDPYAFHGKVVAGTGAQMQVAVQKACAEAKMIHLPVWIMCGTADALVSPMGSQILYDTCSSTDKTLRVYEGGYHELFNDLDKEKVIADVVEWIFDRVPAHPED
jgi:acylglycerol lipase